MILDRKIFPIALVKVLIECFRIEIMKLKETIISQVLNKISSELSNWEKLITVSFLSNEMKGMYFESMDRRKEKLEL